MSESQDATPIVPNAGYTINQAARACQCTPRAFKENLFDTGEIAVARRGKFIALIMGHEILRWIESNMVNAEPSSKIGGGQ